ncbi:MAG: ADP-ribosylglycohydrolase family protein, partial [Ruminococcus sp.]|nr:ADP-ribosylglycohydrolase family protein [Ruminococcus sp.]
PVEFMSERMIFQKYGKNGITDYKLTKGKAIISDDTQMTLFTANGLIYGLTQKAIGKFEGDISDYIYKTYMDWLSTQTGYKNNERISWLIDIPELHANRAPGITCISALSSGKRGNLDNFLNNSKGCGGVMRVAPIGLYYKYLPLDGAVLSADVSAITHGHELGYKPSAVFSYLLYNLLYSENASFESAVIEILTLCDKIFINKKYNDYLNKLIIDALHLANTSTNDLNAIHKLGEGWVAEEALAIALYCSFKYKDDFEKAIITAVNHNGDSDSTGAITGNILGTYLGLSSIPDKFKKNLELYDTIIEIADDLYSTSRTIFPKPPFNKEWTEKYINAKKV